MSYVQGLDILGAMYPYGGGDVTVLGMFDIAARQKDMNSLKQMPVSIAQILLKNGQQVISRAILVANMMKLPGPTARKNCSDHLQWHADTLAKLASSPNMLYASGDDLKKWVMQAFIEENAVEEGAAYLDQAWGQMWAEIGQKIAELPANVAAAVSEAAEGAATMSKWVIGGIVVVVCFVGLLAYKIIAGPVGKRYLP